MKGIILAEGSMWTSTLILHSIWRIYMAYNGKGRKDALPMKF